VGKGGKAIEGKKYVCQFVKEKARAVPRQSMLVRREGEKEGDHLGGGKRGKRAAAQEEDEGRGTKLFPKRTKFRNRSLAVGGVKKEEEKVRGLRRKRRLRRNLVKKKRERGNLSTPCLGKKREKMEVRQRRKKIEDFNGKKNRFSRMAPGGALNSIESKTRKKE